MFPQNFQKYTKVTESRLCLSGNEDINPLELESWRGAESVAGIKVIPESKDINVSQSLKKDKALKV
jgi:hypothetical protein